VALDFTGRGWAFPIGVDATGSIALTDGPALIEQSIRIILGTAYGERPMRPDFGCGVHDLVFAPADARLASRVQQEVGASLRRWEPRIQVRRVTAQLRDEASSVLEVSIDYVVKHENDPRNLVFPFYSIQPERR
jgi:hypothetical protein